METSKRSGLGRWAGRVLAWGFGGLFVWSGLLKAVDPAAFVMSVRSFRLVPDPYAAWVALGLPWLEILAGLAVVTGILRLGGLLLLNVSLVVFIGALISAVVRGLDVDCGCFGGKGTTSAWEGLVRNGLLLVVGGSLAWWHGRRR
jgi:uncharacterized membrane protein YphA (DoxX/SURF4 family)